jgi:hypothetical protein
MDKREIEDLLCRLAEAYEALGGAALTIGICGGAALSVLGLVERTTRDIDLVTPEHLPPAFWQAAAAVAAQLDLPDSWINQGPKELASMGLPEGFTTRAVTKRYGRRLTARYASRLDQIYFKVYAAVDRGGYHVDDLQKLQPTTEELIAAARWCMTHDVSAAFRSMLKSMFEALGYEDVARSL